MFEENLKKIVREGRNVSISGATFDRILLTLIAKHVPLDYTVQVDNVPMQLIVSSIFPVRNVVTHKVAEKCIYLHTDTDIQEYGENTACWTVAHKDKRKVNAASDIAQIVFSGERIIGVAV